MTIKKKLIILLVSALSICLFFAFGFQIDVSGVVRKTGGTADVILEPLKVAADEANAAVEAAQLALEEALAAQAAVQAIVDAPAAALAAAQTAVDEAEAFLALQVPGSEAAEAAQLALEEALAAQAAVQAIVADTTGTALAAAETAVEEARKALAAAILAAEQANAAYSGVKILDEEELKELELAVLEAQLALDGAVAAGADEETKAELQEELDKAIAALEGGESGVGGSMFFHVITNSNNGGSFNLEGNNPGVDGDIVPYTFNAEEGFELVWLRVGNTKILASELDNLFDFNFDKKNLTMHAHFKKVKGDSPEITTEETGLEEGGEPVDDEEDEKGNGKGKGKKEEKSNNGKKNGKNK